MKHFEKLEDWHSGWFCLRAKPRMEKVASATLSSLKNVDVFLPRTIRPKKTAPSIIKPLFPGYLFARFDPILHLRNITFARGVAYVICRKDVPVRVPNQVMVELKLISPDGVVEIPDHPHKVGDNVKIISGLFKGGKGKVTQLLPARERVKVLFEILGQPTEMEIDENSLDFPSAHPMSTGMT